MKESIKMFCLKHIVIIVFLLANAFAASAQGDAARNNSFKDGERLTFHVYYNMSFVWVNAGTAKFSTDLEDVNGKKEYHITGDGKTSHSYEWFYKVKDRYETYIDKETMLPERFVRDVNEGGTKINQDVTFNHKKGEAISNKKLYTIPKGTQDILSSIFYARNIDYNRYKPGDKIPFNLFLDDKVYNVYIKYMGKEQLTTKMGTFNAIKIVPLLIQGTIFTGGEKMTIWVSDDENHLPLRVDSPILVGSVKVDLMEYSNLRNPFTSLISKAD